MRCSDNSVHGFGCQRTDQDRIASGSTAVKTRGLSPEMNLDSGLYVLLMYVDEPVVVQIGALGEHRFESGWYLYVGSARRALTARVSRHLSRFKKVRWHIDYLTTHPGVCSVGAWVLAGTRRTECGLNRAVGKGLKAPIPGFGASDCLQKCPAHLWHATKRPCLVLPGVWVEGSAVGPQPT